jgi:hypothetical protein
MQVVSRLTKVKFSSITVVNHCQRDKTYQPARL